MTLHDPERFRLHPQRVTGKLRHQLEPIHVGGEVDVSAITELEELPSSSAQLERREQPRAVMLEAIVGDAADGQPAVRAGSRRASMDAVSTESFASAPVISSVS
jgi:hypothetical protein